MGNQGTYTVQGLCLLVLQTQHCSVPSENKSLIIQTFVEVYTVHMRFSTLIYVELLNSPYEGGTNCLERPKV